MPFFGAKGHAYRRGRSHGKTLLAQGWDLAGMEASGIPLRPPLLCTYRLEDGSPCGQQVSHWVQMRGYQNTCRKHIEAQWAFLRDHFGIECKEARISFLQLQSEPTKNEDILARLMASTHCPDCGRLLTEHEYVSCHRRCRDHRLKKSKRAAHKLIQGLLHPRSPVPVLS